MYSGGGGRVLWGIGMIQEPHAFETERAPPCPPPLCNHYVRISLIDYSIRDLCNNK